MRTQSEILDRMRATSDIHESAMLYVFLSPENKRATLRGAAARIELLPRALSESEALRMLTPRASEASEAIQAGQRALRWLLALAVPA